MTQPNKNWIAATSSKELREICSLAKERARLLKLPIEERIKFAAQIVVGRVKDHCYNVTVLGIDGDEEEIKNDVGYGKDGDSVIIFLEEANEELGFSLNLYEDMHIKKDVWRKAIKDAMDS
jgi:hypothetical protein